MRDFTWWTQLTVADAKRAVHAAQPSLQRLVVDDVELFSSNALAPAADVQRAHLLPGFDEFMLGYRDRSAALASRHADRIVPGGNGMFLSTLVLDGHVCGRWRRTSRTHGVDIDVTSFARLKAPEKKAFALPAARYADYTDKPVTLTWS